MKIRIKNITQTSPAYQEPPLSPMGIMQMGGLPPKRDAFNRYTAANKGQVSEPWNHDRNIGYGQLPQDLNPMDIANVQQDISDMQSGRKYGRAGQLAVNTPQGVSPVDAFVGTQTGNYSYNPFVYEHQDSKGNVLASRNYGTDYERAFRENPDGNHWFDDAPQQPMQQPVYQQQSQAAPIGQGFSSGIASEELPLAPGFPTREQAVAGKRAQQSNWHTDEEADYSMRYGGQTPPDASGYRRGLDRSWSTNSGPYGVYGRPDEYATRDTLPEAPEGQEDIIVEKKEQILGDFNQDGTAALMGVNTGTHDSGNDQGVSVPDDSFVFSDTKALKIKDSNTQQHFNMPEKKGGYTPAQIAKNYKLQKYTKTLANPDTDQLSRKTAQMMQDNYMKKLQQLAMVQETKKAHMGLTPPAQQYQQGGSYTGDLPLGQGAQEQVFDENGRMGFVPASEYTLPDYTVTGYPKENIARLPILPSMELPPTPNNIQPVPESTGLANSTPPSYIPPPVIDKKKGATAPYNPSAFTTPDRYGMYLRGLQTATVPKDLVYKAPVTGVIPDTVYMDPRRALAANAEQANSAYNAVASSGRGQSNLANYLAIQGQAGKQAADITGDYANKNIAIANAANSNAAQITNQLLEAQRNRADDLVRDTSNANLQYQKRQNEANGNLLNKYTEAWTNRQGYNDLNQTNQYYYRDPATGFMHFRPGMDAATYQQFTNGQGGSSQTIDQLKKEYIASGGNPEYADDYADDIYRKQHGARDRTTTTTRNGNTTTKKTSTQRYGGNLKKFIK